MNFDLLNVPVIGNTDEYGVTRTAEDQAEYDRGLEKITQVREKRKIIFGWVQPIRCG
ncbi:hypothetical protein SAMN05444972_101151 [Marininema halotolerans]|uniref:Uncharacterized protein n=1 Tax=Marininema halotolerans TaxID=1155944 RepID=A0A1I6NUH4_9BACL|nr:hypothetical protein SAMN05444972_101151 [Marininema halotolerans]